MPGLLNLQGKFGNQWDWQASRLPDPILVNALRGLRMFVPMWERGGSVRDYFRMAAATLDSGAVWSTGTHGAAIDFAANNSVVDISGDMLGGLGAFTVLLALDFNNATVGKNGLISNWGGNNPFLWRIDNVNRFTTVFLNTSGGQINFETAVGIAASGFQVCVVRFDGTTLNQFHGGVKDANSTTGSGTVDTGTGYGFSAQAPGTANEFGGIHYLGLAVDWAWPDPLVRYVSDRVFNLLAEPERILVQVPAAVGGLSIPVAMRSYRQHHQSGI